MAGRSFYIYAKTARQLCKVAHRQALRFGRDPASGSLSAEALWSPSSNRLVRLFDSDVRSPGAKLRLGRALRATLCIVVPPFRRASAWYPVLVRPVTIEFQAYQSDGYPKKTRVVKGVRQHGSIAVLN
jgi:hypothetical protein